MERRGFTKTFGVVVVAGLLICLAIYYSLQSPMGTASESKRVRHPAGFSVICPVGWESKVILKTQPRAETNCIMMLPTKPTGWPGNFYVMQRTDSLTETWLTGESYEKHTLQNRLTWRKEWRTRWAKHLSYLFQVDQQWYEIKLERPLTEPIELWWRDFIDSFAIKPSLSTVHPATQAAR